MAALNPFTPAKRVVIKIGSALLVDLETGTLNVAWLEALCDDIAKLKKGSIDVIIVSSGAIALGRQRLGLTRRALNLSEKQACAAAGQSLLTQAYERALGQHGIITAQALLTLNDTEDRRRWLNAKSTVETLLRLGAIPIINENDTVATDEIRYGDNDRLAARTAQMVGADTLILLSDIDGLYTLDPRMNKDAQHIDIVEHLTPDIMQMGGNPNQITGTGTGGMATKLAAAKIATQAGCHMCVTDGKDLHPIDRLSNGAKSSWFKADDNPLKARRQWIKSALKPKGHLTIDTGAVMALRSGKSLLAAGVTAARGTFKKGDAVHIVNQGGQEIARGLTAYSAKDVAKIYGAKSGDIETLLGYDNGSALIHRDNLVLTET